jgi:hypothetical protein
MDAMNPPSHTHVAFADESNWSEGQFRSIALVSMARDDCERFRSEFLALPRQARQAEFKWNDISTPSGKKLADFFFARSGSRMRNRTLCSEWR